MNRFSKLFLFAAFGLVACRPQEASKTKEAIDNANSLLGRYGLNEMPRYEDLRAAQHLVTKAPDGSERLPWTDSYWPTTQKGMARRWGPLQVETTYESDADFAFGSFYRANQKSLATDNWISINLSPAEKFDRVYQSLEKLDPSKTQGILQKLERIDQKLTSLQADSSLSDEERIQRKRELAQEYYQEINRGSVEGGTLDRFYPMTTEGIRNWLAKARSSFYQFPGEYSESAQSWSWEGLCHGWAPAAVMSAEPKHAVRVDIADTGSASSKSLLFTEGDIRGLLTKTWAEASNPDLFFIGRRCDENVDDISKDIPKNSFGRGVGGEFYRWVSGANKKASFTMVQEYPRSTGSRSLMRVILEDEWKDGTPKFAYIIENLDTGTYFYSEDEAKAFAAVETETDQGLEDLQGLRFFGCWDVNPASFHTVLLKNIGAENRGFVMDRTRSGQVWNQPIYKVEFDIGDLISIDSLPEADVAKAYRSPGTRYLAKVLAIVWWASEPYQPRFSYHDGDGVDRDRDLIQSSDFAYTLEFDADQRLIGGEWGSLSSLNVPETPDFLFGYRKAAEPILARYGTTGYLRNGYQKIVKKIHDCSLQGEATASVTLTIPSRWGSETKETFSYVNCKL